MSAVLQIEYPGCPICGGEGRFDRAYECAHHAQWHDPLPTVLDWMVCTACGHSYTRSYWTPEGLKEVFKTTHVGQTAGDAFDPDDRRRDWAPVVREAIRCLGGYCDLFSSPTPPLWVDVGCGDGALIMMANEAGFQEFGIDTREQTILNLNGAGYTAATGDFMALALTEQKATVVSMMDVLEHLPYPVTALRHVRTLLDPDGLLIISLPNMNSSSWRILDMLNENPYWMEIEHHHNFTLARLKAVLAAEGFEVVSVDFPTRYRGQMELYARPVL